MPVATHDLDLIFRALADPTRRMQIRRLTEGPATIRELSEPFEMTLPAASKHVRILEKSGLLACKKVGRSHVCTLRPDTLKLLDEWLVFYRPFWDSKLDNLNHYLTDRVDETNQRS